MSQVQLTVPFSTTTISAKAAIEVKLCSVAARDSGLHDVDLAWSVQVRSPKRLQVKFNQGTIR